MDVWQYLGPALDWGLTGFTVILILTGKLVWHTQSDRWFQAWEKSQTTNHELLKQNSQLIEAGRTTTRVIEALPKVGDSS